MFRKIMKNKSIFSYLLVVMCILVLIETTILVGSLSTGGMFAKILLISELLIEAVIFKMKC